MAICTMTQALKKLYKAVVGSDTTKNNPTKIVSDLADNYSGGGASLPEVTASDNGMVLTVVEGEWDKAAGGGGAEPLVATYNSTTHVLDKTYGEIAQAIENGGIGSVTIKMSDAEYCAIITFMFAYDIYGYSMTVGDGGYMFQEGAETDYPMYTSD